MARTVETIYNDIITEKETLSNLDGLLPTNDTYQDLLTDLDAGSAVSEWRLWAFIFAVHTHALEVLQDLFIEEVEELSASAIVGTLPWYVAISKEYEPGVSLALVDSRWIYETPVPENRLVLGASASASAGTIFLKVAKGDGGDPEGLEPLSGAELTAFTSYIKQRGFAGDSFNIQSLNGDTLEIEVEIFYDGFKVEATVQAAVEAAIDAYLLDLDFDGVVKVIKMIDAIQTVDGVRDVVISSLTGVNGAVETVFTREYETKAGYIALDSGESTFTMTAETDQ